MQAGLDSKDAQAAAMQEECIALSEQVRTLTEELTALRVTHTTSEESASQRKSEVDAAHVEVKRLQEQLKAAQLVAVDMEATSAADAKAKDQSEKHIVELTDTITQLQLQYTQRQKQQEQEVNKEEIQSAHADEQSQAISLLTADLHLKSNALIAADVQAAAALQELVELRSQVSQLSDALRTSTVDIDDKNIELAAKSDELAANSGELRAINEDNASVDSGVLEISTQKDETAVTESQVNELSEQIRLMKDQLKKTGAKFIQKIALLKSQVCWAMSRVAIFASYLTLSHLIISYPISSYLILSHLIILYLTLSLTILSHPTDTS